MPLLVFLAGCPDGGDDDATSSPPPTSTPATPGRIQVDVTSISFPDTQVGDTSLESVTLTNPGSGPLTLYAVYFPDDGDGAFLLAPGTSDPSGTVLQSEDALTLGIAFSPGAAGTFQGTWRIASDDPDNPNLDIELSGTGLEPPSPDDDDDGVTVADGDCDDQDASVYPGATEVCNGADDDCDAEIDEDAADAFPIYADTDGDGYGLEDGAEMSCDLLDGYALSGGDCDDTSASVYPDAEEICDGLDNDCDGARDEEAADAITVYPDGDGDGFGATSGTLQACSPPDGYVTVTGDCDDSNAEVNPGATEICDGLDNDCDGLADNAGDTLFYTDGDGDGHGDPDTGVPGCGSSQGQVALGDDCDDTDPATYPGADERCDGLDNDCDADVDESPADGTAFYADTDGDGFGAGDPILACSPSEGLADNDEDCDDDSPTTYPGADEPCDGVDNNCDGQVDEGGQTTLYADVDGDGWGNDADTIVSCTTEGYVGTGGDCNDLDPAIHPAAEEVCDNQDQDCDGLVDEEVGTIYYLDRDGDGYGDDETTATACSPPSTVFLEQGGDCNDLDAAVNPGVAETCNSVDDDCDGLVDEDTADSETYYLDADEDGYGDPGQSVSFCKQPEVYVPDGSDCNDADAGSPPGMAEVCDDIDQDCNGVIDDDPTDSATWYPDVDQDGYGSIAGGVAACDQPPGYLPDTGDCNDSVASIHPDAAEICDGVDQDCDGLIDEDMTWAWYIDRDGDGYGDADTEFLACSAPSDFYVDEPGDCDDFDADVFPGSNELCNGKDDDCNGAIDEPAAVDASTWYQDADGDDHGDPDAPQVACYQPEGYVPSLDDCDDGDASVHAAAVELCNDKDDDCDGTTDEPDAADAPTWYLDVDGDGYGTALSSQLNCTQPDGYVAEGTDCNDSDPTVNPGATEMCNGKDDDCDGVTDGTDAVDGATWYQDADSDGYGHPDRTQVTCDQPVGYVDNGLDCDDLEADTNPSAPELPTDGRDNDCDGKIDENGPLAALPVGLADHATVYDPIRERVVVFGGRTTYDIVGDVYVLDLSGGNTGAWEILEPAPDPSDGTPEPRFGHAAVFDAANDQVVVFGGKGYYDLYADAWILSFASSESGSWTRLAPGGDTPAPRVFHAAAFDPVDGQMLIHGGRSFYRLSAAVWGLTLPPATPAWTLLNDGSSDSPGPRERQCLEFDSIHDRVLMFGGDGIYARNDDLWAFDPATAAWTRLQPDGTPPPGLAGSTVTFHVEASELLLFGGMSYYDISSTLYALDVATSLDGTWSVLDTPGPFAPVAGSGSAVVDIDALYLLFFGQGYYERLARPQSGQW